MNEGVNKVLLLGRLGATPELRVTQAGLPVLHLRLATNDSWVDKDKVRRERTEWHTVVVFGRRAEALARVLTKGMPVFVEGSLRGSTYEKDGVRRHTIEVIAKELLLVGSAGRDTDGELPEDQGDVGAPVSAKKGASAAGGPGRGARGGRGRGGAAASLPYEMPLGENGYGEGERDIPF